MRFGPIYWTRTHAKFVRMLKSNRQGILYSAYHRIHTSKSEGINNKIKTMKRQHYGCHDKRCFTLRVKEALPGKPTGLQQAHASQFQILRQLKWRRGIIGSQPGHLRAPPQIARAPAAGYLAYRIGKGINHHHPDMSSC